MIKDNIFDVLCTQLEPEDVADVPGAGDFENVIVKVTASSRHWLSEAYGDMLDNYCAERREKVINYELAENETAYLSLVAALREEINNDDFVFRVVGCCLIESDNTPYQRLVWSWLHPFFRKDETQLDFVKSFESRQVAQNAQG